MGFKPVSYKKGVYIDGHKREDVVKYRCEYLKTLEDYRKNYMPGPLCSDEQPLLPSDLTPSEQNDKKLVIMTSQFLM